MTQSLKANRPRIAIVGRPNVGKSSLFNRLYGRKRALVHDLPGVTRDRLIEDTNWWVEAKSYDLALIDTGGVGGDTFAEEIHRQVKVALKEADLVLWVVDGQVGLQTGDRQVLSYLRTEGVLDRLPTILVVNKVDQPEWGPDRMAPFYELGVDQCLSISAEHAFGISDLQKEVVTLLKIRPNKTRKTPDVEQELTETDIEDEVDLSDDLELRLPRVAVIGRPNTGKSTLINSLLGENRMIASPIAGTTVDSVDSEITWGGHKMILIDTAGIRRKSKTEKGVEVLSIIQTQKALERADLAILMLDGVEGPTEQDEKIAGIAVKEGLSLIVAINKWDLRDVRKGQTREQMARNVAEEMGFLRWAPMVVMSAQKKIGMDSVPDLIVDILEQRKLKLNTRDLTEWMRQEAEIHNPANVKFYLCHQTSRRPPTFVCHVNDPKKVHYSLERHLINAIREKWGYQGTPIRLLFKKGKSDPTRKKESLPSPSKTRRTNRRPLSTHRKPRKYL